MEEPDEATRVMKETITLKPIGIFFCNTNKDMGLSAHCHYAEVQITFQTIGDIGFPSFHDTFEEVKNFVQGLKLKPFKGTNEMVARYIWNQLLDFDFPATQKYGGDFEAHSMTLNVMGLRDENNHADGFTTYKIQAN